MTGTLPDVNTPGAQLFFCRDQASERSIEEIDLPSPAYSIELWRPGRYNPVPPGLPLLPFAVWTLFHYFKIFKRPDYGILLVRCSGKIIHRTCIFPKYPRFPFMSRFDLQIGDTWTDGQHRGKGIAVYAIQWFFAQVGTGDGKYWYICDESNQASTKVALKCGFTLIGRGVRLKRFGLGLLGYFSITESSS
jgi:RimJ/RimL family protein N-acetyltransferase